MQETGAGNIPIERARAPGLYSKWKRAARAEHQPTQGDQLDHRQLLRSPGHPAKRGRSFTNFDGPTSQPVVIVNERLARMLWPDEDPIGRELKWGIEASDGPWMTIVGVVEDAKEDALGTPTVAQTYVPLAQESEMSFVVAGQFYRTVNLVVRSSGDLQSLISELHRAVHDLDPALASIFR